MKKIYKFFAVLLIISLIFPGIKTVNSYAAQSEDILQPINSSLLNFAINPNSTTHIRVPFETLNNNVFAEIFSIAAESDDSLITVSNLKIVDTKTGRVEFAQGQTNSLAMYSDTYALDFDVTPHQLRHTYITNLIYNGVDPKTVQYLAGHENSKTTMDIYAKVKYNKPIDLIGVVNSALSKTH